jgi:deoxyribodipyrimidine photo-lyase
MSTILLWLRSDLRLHDHEALEVAVRQARAGGGTVVPVYVVDPRVIGATTPLGWPKTGAFRLRFLLETLVDLRAALRTRGSDLVVRYGMPEAVLPVLAREVGATSCAYHEEATDEETRTEDAVELALAAMRIPCTSVWGHTLLHPDDLPFEIERLPVQFTAFRERVEVRAASAAERAFRPECAPRAVREAPAALPPLPDGLDVGTLPTFDALGIAPPVDDPRATRRFAGGETAGLARLARWTWEVGALPRYKETRNGLLLADDASTLSPWLAHGALSPRRVFAEVQRWEATHGRTEGSYWLVFELLWRDFFRFVALQRGTRLFALDGFSGRRQPWRTLGDASARADLERWRTGTTGVPFVDAGMRELLHTGFTTNRMRQNVASWLVKRAEIDWRTGAEWFESQLVDYDPCSNWGNWAYLAGVGNDPRGDRTFDAARQASLYDPTGAFVRHWHS